MLAFLHTARVHVETFGRLANELDAAIPIRHEVRESLLEDAVQAGTITDAVRSATIAVVQALAQDGAKVIVCTCSTLGSVAEAVPVSDRVRVMRIDRPMAERAVASGRRILVCATLQSTFEPTLALLRHVASESNSSIEVVEVLCESAWRFFQSGEHVGYVREIARAIEATACSGDLVLLAQASMAPASELLGHLGIPVLSSPKLGLEAAMSMYRMPRTDS
jgi:hypothetical protein